MTAKAIALHFIIKLSKLLGLVSHTNSLPKNLPSRGAGSGAHRLRNLHYSNGIDCLARMMVGLLFDTEVVAGPDICNNFARGMKLVEISYTFQ